MSLAFHRRLKFRRTFAQRLWDFKVSANGTGFWRTVWAAIVEAWTEDFR